MVVKSLVFNFYKMTNVHKLLSSHCITTQTGHCADFARGWKCGKVFRVVRVQSNSCKFYHGMSLYYYDNYHTTSVNTIEVVIPCN
jgi:hypothetical protein